MREKGKGSRNEMARLCLYDPSGFSSVVSGVVVLAMHTDEDLLTAAASESGPIASRSFLLSLHGMASVFMMAMGIINISLPIRGELCCKATYNPTPIIPKEADR